MKRKSKSYMNIDDLVEAIEQTPLGEPDEKYKAQLSHDRKILCVWIEEDDRVYGKATKFEIKQTEFTRRKMQRVCEEICHKVNANVAYMAGWQPDGPW